MNLPTEIKIGNRKLYVLDLPKNKIEILVDCAVTGGMMRIPITVEQYVRWQGVRKELIQEIFPELCAELREVLISGQTPAEWNAIFNSLPYTKEELIEKFHYEFEN